MKKNQDIKNSKIQSILGINYMYFIKNTIFMSFPILIGSLMKLIQNIAFARLADKDTYGQFIFIISVISILSIISLPGIKVPTVKAVSLKKTSAYKTLNFVKTKYSLIGSLICFAVAVYYFIGNNRPFSYSLLLTAVLFVPYCGLNLWTSFYTGRKQFKKLAFLLSVIYILSTLAILLALKMGYSLPVLVTVSIIFYALFNVVLTFKTGLPGNAAPEEVSGDVKLAKHLTFLESFGTLFSNIDKILLAFFANYSVLAVYQIASSFHNQFKSLLQMETGLLLPKLSEVKKDAAFMKIRKRFALITVVSVILGITGYFITKPVMIILFSDKYDSSVPYAEILMLFLGIGFPSRVIKTLFEAHSCIKELYILNLVIPAVSVVLMVPLIYLWGISGAVFAVCFYWTASLVASYYLAFYNHHE